MMTRMCQLQRFEAEYPLPEKEEKRKPQGTRNFILEIETYELLLKHVQRKKKDVRSLCQLPHPEGSFVLKRYATPVQYHHVKIGFKDTLISPMEPNNCISYQSSGRRQYVMVQQIYAFEGPSGEREWEVNKELFQQRFGGPFQKRSMDVVFIEGRGGSN